jgi:hypothetical protein
VEPAEEYPKSVSGCCESALRAIEQLKKQPGFKKNPKLRNQKTDHSNGFNINRVRFGADNWSEGFDDEI